MPDVVLAEREKTPVVVPLVLIGGIVTFITTLPLLGVMSAFIWCLPGAIAGAVVGAPLFWLARRLGMRGLLLCTLLGAVAGALVVAIGAIPNGWARPFDAALRIATIIGAATGAIYGTVFDVDNLPPGTVRWRTMLILLVAIVLAFLLTMKQ